MQNIPEQIFKMPKTKKYFWINKKHDKIIFILFKSGKISFEIILKTQ